MRFCVFALLTLLVVPFAQADEEETTKSIRDYLKIETADRIVVTYGPEGDFDVKKARTKEVTNAEHVKDFLEVCHAIPAASRTGLLVSFGDSPPEYRIDFFKGEKKLGTLRMIGGSLDIPATDGWDFYSKKEDEPFVAMIAALQLDAEE